MTDTSHGRPIAILGSTGSVGVSTLALLERFPDRFRAVALAAGRNMERLAEQIRRHEPTVVSVADESTVGGPRSPRTQRQTSAWRDRIQ